MSETGVAEGYLTKEEEAYFTSGGAKEPENTENLENDGETSEESSAPDGGDASTDEPQGDSGKYSKHDSDVDVGTDSLATQGDSADLDDGIESDDEPPIGKKRDLEKAFKTERHKRKEMREKLEANESRTRELENRLSQLQEALSKNNQQVTPQEPPEVVPDPEDDPLGYQQYKINKLEQAISNQSQYLKQQYDSAQRSHSEAAFKTHYENQAKEYAKKQPDFMDAYSYLMGARLQEHLAAGFTEQQAQQLLIEDEVAVASLAFKDHVNPAERIYAIAKTRGYVPGKNQSKGKSPSIESIKKGLDNSKSLKSGGGELPGRMQGADEIDGMTFDEFDQFWSGYKNKAKAIR